MLDMLSRDRDHSGRAGAAASHVEMGDEYMPVLLAGVCVDACCGVDVALDCVSDSASGLSSGKRGDCRGEGDSLTGLTSPSVAECWDARLRASAAALGSSAGIASISV